MTTEAIIQKFERYVVHNYGRFPLAIARGEGSWVWDVEGKRYLDFICGIAVNNLGHRHPAVARAIEEQLGRLVHVSNLFHIEPQANLAELLVENSIRGAKAFFCNSGTEANEAAIKMARKWGAANGGKYKILSALGSFHGRTLGSLSATGQRKYQRGFAPLVPGFKFVPYGDAERVERALRDEKFCAVIAEPIQGEGGVNIPSDDYLPKLREICTRRGALLILDEIQVGLGRTGRMFAYQRSGIEPDIITLAKALGGGIPCGAVIATDDAAMYLTPGSHGTTLGGNPLAMSAGCAVVRTILDEGLLDNAARMGEYFLGKLRALKLAHGDTVRDARGRGLILGVELFDGDIAKRAVRKSLNNGLLAILTEERVIRLLPPLNVRADEIDFAVETLDKSIREA
ncbi:MAG: acetylornithine transaminase [Deltaproteobacteria bacterium]